MAGPVVMKGPIQAWMDHATANAAGRADFLSKLNDLTLTLRDVLDQSVGYVWTPNANTNYTINSAELNTVQAFWFPTAQLETNLRASLKHGLELAVAGEVPLDSWWECTSLTPNTREVYVRQRPQKVSALFYSDLPLGAPAVSVFQAAQPASLNELTPTRSGGQRFVLASEGGETA
jgi:hypothetical protein